MGNEEKKKPKVVTNFILAVILTAAVGGFCFAGYQLYAIQKEYQAGEEEYKKLSENYMTEERDAPESIGESTGENVGGELEELDTYGILSKNVDIEGLIAENPDTIGWLEYPGLGISYPIMYSEDNGYYLKHTFNKTENTSGSIFMDAVNSPDFQDYHTIIYGHNMKNGSMFGSLKKLKNEEDYKSSNYFVIYTRDKASLYQVFSCHEAAYDSDIYTVGYQPDEAYTEFLNNIKSQSLYDTGVEVTREDRVVTLSTCTGSKTIRFVVHGRLAE